MVRLGFAGLTAVLLASAAPAAAAPGDDTPAEVMRDCGGDSLPRDEVSSCLERARVLDQSNPSAELQSLEARLEQRIGNSPDDENAAPPPPRYDRDNADNEDQPPPDDEMGPDDQGPPVEEYGPDDRQPPDAGTWDDDEPPIDDGEDGYDNSQPDQDYDAPDAPDDGGGPPPDDDDGDAYDSGQG
jgi:hypothetical protein